MAEPDVALCAWRSSSTALPCSQCGAGGAMWDGQKDILFPSAPAPADLCGEVQPVSLPVFLVTEGKTVPM